jgi:hypothetical protein
MRQPLSRFFPIANAPTRSSPPSSAPSRSTNLTASPRSSSNAPAPAPGATPRTGPSSPSTAPRTPRSRPTTRSSTPSPPPTTLSFALGVALGRFDPAGKLGILDPRDRRPRPRPPARHPVPRRHARLRRDLRRPRPPRAAALLHTAWSEHAAAIDSKRKHLRDYLRHDFFADVHRAMYENRPIHWPLSSSKKTFVAWVNIHRWHAGTLRYLLAEHLHPTKQRLDGEVTDLRKVRDGADTKAARTAEKRLTQVSAARDELAEFIADLKACAEQGPPQPDPKTPARANDAVYDPDLDDGVMINSRRPVAAARPAVEGPQEVVDRAGHRRGPQGLRLVAPRRPLLQGPRRLKKCKDDPSLAVAHGCFWKLPPRSRLRLGAAPAGRDRAGLHDRRGRVRRVPQTLPGQALSGGAGDPAKRAGPTPSQAREGRHRGAAGHPGRRGERR